MDKNTVTRLRSLNAQLGAYTDFVEQIKEGATHPTDKHHLQKAKRGLQQAQNHLRVAIVGLLDQIHTEGLNK